MQRKSKTPKTVHFDQWIEIKKIDENKSVVTFYPPNDEFERLRKKRDPQPTLIYRRLNFVNGVAPEYDWTEPTEDARQYGGHNLQRMTVEDWLYVMRAEALIDNVRVLPPRRFQPRPPELGPCPCDKCTARREEEEEAERQAIRRPVL